MNARNDEQRGVEAKLVLENEIYREAVKQIEANIVAQMAQQATTPEKGEDLRKLLIALRKVNTYIEQVAVTGRMAAMEEDRKRSLAERMAQRFSTIV
jgi:hypothetical protein